MNKLVIMGLGAVISAAPVWAEDEEGAAQEVPVAATEVKSAPKVFTTLPLCRRVEGDAEVRLPGANSWQPIEEGRFYPLGSGYRTLENGELEIAFGPECTAKISSNSSFGTRGEKIGGASRTLLLEAGTITLKLPENMPENAFIVSAPSFVVTNPAGESKYDYTDLGDGFEAVVRCVTGTMAVEGRHFSIPKMRAANEFRLRSDRDNLETILYGTSGDYVIKLDRGVVTKSEVDENGAITESSVQDFLEWHLSPETKVQINRAVPSIGERMSVTMLTFDPAGTLKNNFAFSEGRSEVNTGELIASDKVDAAAIAKKAAEATTEEVAAEDEEASDNNEEKEEE